MCIQRQQTLDRIGDHQHAVRMTGQAQWTATGVGQDLALRAVEAAADQPAVMQSGDEEFVFQQQRLRPFDVARPDLCNSF